jgi:hypothetical protein
VSGAIGAIHGLKRGKSPSETLAELNKLEAALMEQRGVASKQGGIEKIDAALGQLNEAKSAVEEKIASSKAKIAEERDSGLRTHVNPLDDDFEIPASPEATKKIKTINGVQGQGLVQGERFDSINGHGKSYNNFMKTNISGLNELLNLKNI